MLQIVVGVLAIIYAFRLPGILRTPMEQFPSASPDLYARWRSKEIWSVVWLLLCTWGDALLVFLVALGLAATNRQFADDIAAGRGIYMAIVLSGTVIWLGGLIVAAVLSSQAAKIKRLMMMPRTDAGYYPRPGA